MSIATRVRKAGEKVVAAAVVPVAAFGIAACGNEESGATGGSNSEARYASSCADVYKADDNARIYPLVGYYNTFEEAIDNGAIKDTDNSTAVTQFTDIQRAQLIVSFGKVNDMYAPKISPVASPESLGDLNVVVYQDPTDSTSAEARDGRLVGDACVMYGDKEAWYYARTGGTDGDTYVDGDVVSDLRPSSRY